MINEVAIAKINTACRTDAAPRMNIFRIPSIKARLEGENVYRRKKTFYPEMKILSVIIKPHFLQLTSFNSCIIFSDPHSGQIILIKYDIFSTYLNIVLLESMSLNMNFREISIKNILFKYSKNQ